MKYLKRFNESLDDSCIRIDKSEYNFGEIGKPVYTAVDMRDSVIKTSKKLISGIEDYIHYCYQNHWSSNYIKWDRDSGMRFKHFKYSRPSAKDRNYVGIEVEIRETEDFWIFVKIWIYGADDIYFKCDQEWGLSKVLDEFKKWWDVKKTYARLENI